MSRLYPFLIAILLAFSSLSSVFAQEPEGPIYIVQPGDNLTLIASRFGITTTELINANSISDPNSLKVGDELLIPGLSGVTGYLITQPVPYGENLHSLASKYDVSIDLLVTLNHITSPAELYAGTNLIIPQSLEQQTEQNRAIIKSGQSLFEMSILTGLSNWDFLQPNHLDNSWKVVQGEIIRLPAQSTLPSAGISQPLIKSIELKPLPVVQGKTAVIQVVTTQPVSLSGSLVDHTLKFQQVEANSYIALQGLHAMQEPGVYPLTLSAQSDDGSNFQYQQMIMVQNGFYGKDPVILVKDEFIDPAKTQPELDWLTTTVASITPEKYWNGIWLSPSPYSYLDCLNSKYGNRRSYNGSPFDYFHSGVDFCGGEGTQITAPAAGVVVFSGPLEVRGNATIIDHGWGVYSGYWHQQSSLVKIGDKVEPGQVIGTVGATGRVTGAHLHWEIWVGGVQVQPLDWLQTVYP